jgi:hypothetical protein
MLGRMVTVSADSRGSSSWHRPRTSEVAAAVLATGELYPAPDESQLSGVCDAQLMEMDRRQPL